jgi:hypothetical protein
MGELEETSDNSFGVGIGVRQTVAQSKDRLSKQTGEDSITPNISQKGWIAMSALF